MVRHWRMIGAVVTMSFGAGLFVGRSVPANAQGRNRDFEIRTATLSSRSARDKLAERFHTQELSIFERLGMRGVGFFVPTDSPKSETTFFYILGHESRERAKESWDKFRDDPEWQKIRVNTEDLGPITVDSMFVEPLGFSPLK